MHKNPRNLTHHMKDIKEKYDLNMRLSKRRSKAMRATKNDV